MEKHQKNAAGEEKATPVIVVEQKSKSFRINVIAAALTVTAVIVAATILCVNFYKDNKDLRDDLARQKQLLSDLEAHNNALETDNKSLEEKLAALLKLQEAEPVITSAQLKEQLSAIRELVTQEYMYTNADKEEQGMTWSNGWSVPFSEKSFVVKYDGTIKAGIDLNDVEIHVDEDHHKITVTLPASKMIDHNVPQETIEVFGVKDGLFNKVTPNDPNELISRGKESMNEKAEERGLLAEADREAEIVVREFLSLIPGVGTTYQLEVNHK